MRRFTLPDACLVAVFIGSMAMVDNEARAIQSPLDATQPVGKARIEFVRGSERRPAPLEVVAGHLVFPVTIEGKQVWGVLDNRAGTSVIDSNFVRAQGYQLGQKLKPFQTPTGPVDRYFVPTLKVVIPGQVAITAPMSALDLSLLSKAVRRPITFVLGNEYFRELGVLVQPRRGQLQIGPSGRLTTPPNTPFVKLAPGYPAAEVQVSGKTLTAHLDLGFNGELAIAPANWRKLGLKSGRTIARLGGDGRGKPYAFEQTTTPLLTMGPFEAQNVEVDLRAIPAGTDALIGAGFLSRFDFYLDQKANKLFFLGN